MPKTNQIPRTVEAIYNDYLPLSIHKATQNYILRFSTTKNEQVRDEIRLELLKFYPAYVKPLLELIKREKVRHTDSNEIKVAINRNKSEFLTDFSDLCSIIAQVFHKHYYADITSFDVIRHTILNIITNSTIEILQSFLDFTYYDYDEELNPTNIEEWLPPELIHKIKFILSNTSYCYTILTHQHDSHTFLLPPYKKKELDKSYAINQNRLKKLLSQKTEKSKDNVQSKILDYFSASTAFIREVDREEDARAVLQHAFILSKENAHYEYAFMCTTGILSSYFHSYTKGKNTKDKLDEFSNRINSAKNCFTSMDSAIDFLKSNQNLSFDKEIFMQFFTCAYFILNEAAILSSHKQTLLTKEQEYYNILIALNEKIAEVIHIAQNKNIVDTTDISSLCIKSKQLFANKCADLKTQISILNTNTENENKILDDDTKKVLEEFQVLIKEEKEEQNKLAKKQHEAHQQAIKINSKRFSRRYIPTGTSQQKKQKNDNPPPPVIPEKISPQQEHCNNAFKAYSEDHNYELMCSEFSLAYQKAVMSKDYPIVVEAFLGLADYYNLKAAEIIKQDDLAKGALPCYLSALIYAEKSLVFYKKISSPDVRRTCMLQEAVEMVLGDTHAFIDTHKKHLLEQKNFLLQKRKQIKAKLGNKWYANKPYYQQSDETHHLDEITASLNQIEDIKTKRSIVLKSYEDSILKKINPTVTQTNTSSNMFKSKNNQVNYTSLSIKKAVALP